MLITNRTGAMLLRRIFATRNATLSRNSSIYSHSSARFLSSSSSPSPPSTTDASYNAEKEKRKKIFDKLDATIFDELDDTKKAVSIETVTVSLPLLSVDWNSDVQSICNAISDEEDYLLSTDGACAIALDTNRDWADPSAVDKLRSIVDHLKTSMSVSTLGVINNSNSNSNSSWLSLSSQALSVPIAFTAQRQQQQTSNHSHGPSSSSSEASAQIIPVFKLSKEITCGEYVFPHSISVYCNVPKDNCVQSVGEVFVYGNCKGYIRAGVEQDSNDSNDRTDSNDSNDRHNRNNTSIGEEDDTAVLLKNTKVFLKQFNISELSIDGVYINSVPKESKRLTMQSTKQATTPPTSMRSNSNSNGDDDRWALMYNRSVLVTVSDGSDFRKTRKQEIAGIITSHNNIQRTQQLRKQQKQIEKQKLFYSNKDSNDNSNSNSNSNNNSKSNSKSNSNNSIGTLNNRMLRTLSNQMKTSASSSSSSPSSSSSDTSDAVAAKRLAETRVAAMVASKELKPKSKALSAADTEDSTKYILTRHKGKIAVKYINDDYYQQKTDTTREGDIEYDDESDEDIDIEDEYDEAFSLETYRQEQIRQGKGGTIYMRSYCHQFLFKFEVLPTSL